MFGKRGPLTFFSHVCLLFFLLLSLSLPMPLRLLVQILRIFFPNAFRSAEVMEDFAATCSEEDWSWRGLVIGLVAQCL